MYDMYPWDSASQGDYPPEPLRSRRNASTPRETSPAEAAQAVQIALDRRDNGGDASAPAPPAAAAPPAASAHATPPTASLTRQ